MKILFLLTACVVASNAQATKIDKKLIEYGWDCPTTEFVRQNLAKMETIPFDGVVIQVTHPDTQESLGWRVFSKTRFRPSEYAHAIRDLATLKPKKLKDNFIQVIAMPGEVDWFDDEWSAVAHNAACLAKVARLGGCKGIMFDPEHYGKNLIWSYAALPPEKKANHSYEEYASKVRERGREFIRAINAEFPDITILALYGHALPYQLAQAAGGLDKAEYGLLAAFYDGICEAATPGTILIDGFEQSYPFKSQQNFQDGRRIILRDARTISTVPDAFLKHVRAGFGVWADFASGQLGWHPEDFTLNYFSPTSLRAALSFALEQSDGYVWVYSERLKWWDFNVPHEYIQALALAKKGSGSRSVESKATPPSNIPRACQQQGYSDNETFAEFRKTFVEIADLPKDGWRFCRDDANCGEKKGWYRRNFDDSGWRLISIGKFWEEQGETFDGIGWYRLKFVAPKTGEITGPNGTVNKIFLVFGAVDESAWVWLNGRYVGSHDVGPIGWTMPFKIDVTETLKPGAENLLVVKALDTSGAGGIWKSIKLMGK